nr:probable serine/threonine-protein kinase At1g54610 [Oryza sativa Japonica Group]
MLKIADFGLATFFDAARPQPLTSRVVTLWYRPPELLLGATEYGVAVDLCSTGCMPASSPSFSPYWVKAKLPDVTLFKPQWPYRRKIAETFRDFSPPALDLLDTLLAIEPSDRATGAPRHRRLLQELGQSRLPPLPATSRRPFLFRPQLREMCLRGCAPLPPLPPAAAHR